MGWRAVWTAVALLVPSMAAAQADWPIRPIRILVPYAAGGNSDAVARIAAQYMQEALKGAPVIVENRGGAGGLVGTEAVAKAPPDGYTLLLGAIGPITIAPATQKLTFDPAADLVPISLLSTNPLVLLVNPSLPADSVAQLVALARARPGALNFSSAGVGGLTHFSAEIFKAKTGVEMVHVPYKGGAPATMALIAGEVQVTFANYSDALPQVAAGKARALAVTTARRTPQSPEVPTVAEAGVPGYECESWNGLLAPRGTPPAIIDRLAAIASAMAADPAVQKRMAEIGSVAVAATPQAYAEKIRAEIEQWRALVVQANIKVED
jgi:tripartite-type tricarboxylate transporter receptor subunit TctC